jgi:Domain of unknown function (DUF5134)
VTGPGWVNGVFAALVILIALACAGRLVEWRLRGRRIEPDADGLHVAMGVAMAGMFEPRLSPVPGTVWLAAFAVAGAWFGWHAIRGRGSAGSLQCSHPAPHAVECAAMIYMLLPADLAGRGPGMTMPGMANAQRSAGNPMIAFILAVFMLGYLVWTADQLAAMSRARRVPVASRPNAGNGALAPRLAVGYKIAMSLAMGYMLLTML